MSKVQTKPWYQSTTLWINIVPMVIMVLDLVIQTKMIPDADVILVLQGILNILNRFRNVEVKKITL